jgi:hypothetical protein
VLNGAWPDDSSVTIRDLSCPATGSCVAVGDRFRRIEDGTGVADALVLTLRAGQWALTAVPPLDPDTGRTLDAVSCASPTSCLAVGGDGTVNGGTVFIRSPRALVLEDDGWHVAPPLPAATPPPRALTDVACLASRCLTIGETTDALTSLTATYERDTGTRLPVGAHGAGLVRR